MSIVTGIQSKDVPRIWPSVARFIAAGLGEGETLENTFDRLNKRQCQLWTAKDNEKIIAAAVTEIVTLEGRKICNVLSIGGSGLDEWIDNLGFIEAWAISNKCVAMRHANCRPGWRRILKDYQVKFLVLEKVL